MDIEFTPQDARQIIADDAASFQDWCRAALTLIYGKGTTFDDLLCCLRRPGLPAEWAAIELYLRTNRPRVGGGPASVIVDADDWRRWLAEKRLVTSSAT